MATADKKQTTRAASTRAAKAAAPKKAAAAKTAPKKTAAPKVNLVFQYQGRELSQAGMVDAVTNAWISAGNDASAIETLELYVKPEDNAVYYVINGSQSGKFDF